MAMTLQVAGVTLPLNNLTQVKIGDELIWSSNTGRSASSGKMLGDIVAKKKTISLGFSWIKKTDFETIRDALETSAFNTVLLKLDGSTILNAKCYRSNIEREIGGNQGGVWYYSSASFDLIQQ
jgi:hypothetical protein